MCRESTVRGDDALRPGRADVVLVLHIEHGCSRDPGDDRERNRAERDRRQDQVLDRIPERRPVTRDDRVEDVEVRRVLELGQDADPAYGREPAEPDREDVFEDDREHEDRDRDPEQRREQAEVVEEAAVAFRRQEAERDPDEDREEHRPDRQLDRRRKALEELVEDRPSRRDRVAEVDRPDLLEIGPVLLLDRLVEAVLLVDRRDLIRGRPLAEQGRRRAARQGPDPEEDQDREPEQDRDDEDEPADDEAQHVVRRTLVLPPTSPASPARTTRSSSGSSRTP